MIRARALAAHSDALFDALRSMSNNIQELIAKPASELTEEERRLVEDWHADPIKATEHLLRERDRVWKGQQLSVLLGAKKREIEREERHRHELEALEARHDAQRQRDQALKQEAAAKLREQQALIAAQTSEVESLKLATTTLSGVLKASQAGGAGATARRTKNMPEGVGQASLLISEVWGRYKAEKIAIGQIKGGRGGWSNGEHAAAYHHWPHVRALIDLIGDKPIADVTKADVRSFRQHVLNQGDSAANKEKRLQRAGALFRWACKEDMIADSFAEAFKLGFQVEGNNYKEFTPDDLKKLFESDDYRFHKFQTAYDYWLPILGLFTGGRINELAQLHVADVRQQDGIHIISVLDDESSKQLKTTGSRRIVPIHSKLIELGFIDFVDAARRAGQQRIFSELKEAKVKTHDYGRMATQHFTKYRRKVGVITPETEKFDPKTQTYRGRGLKVFHSFRTTLICALRDAGVPQERRERIAGHEPDGVHNRNYNGGDKVQMFPVATLQADIEKAVFPVEFQPSIRAGGKDKNEKNA
ncbi:MAG: site-specific integrase [Rhodocyclaceae bacterium]